MQTIAHISDLHFGKANRRTEEALLKELKALRPALTVVSGDLTRRAFLRQFKRASAFLERLPKPSIIVPGNHDVPVAFAHRFLAPLARYKYFINTQLSPVRLDREFCILGLNTVRSFAIEAGGFSRRQLLRAERILRTFPKRTLKIILTHHPFIRPPGIPRYRRLLVGAEMALETFERCGVDLIIAGHFHRPHIADIRGWYPHIGRSMIHAQVGIALGKHMRNDLLSYNVLSLSRNRISIAVKVWNGEAFEETSVTTYRRNAQGWKTD